MLSRKEYKYRQKIINEFHCNKNEQQILDEFKNSYEYWNTYYKIYNSLNYCPIYRTISFKRILNKVNKLQLSFNDFGVAVKNTDGSLRNFKSILNDISEKWNRM